MLLLSTEGCKRRAWAAESFPGHTAARAKVLSRGSVGCQGLRASVTGARLLG